MDEDSDAELLGLETANGNTTVSDRVLANGSAWRPDKELASRPIPAHLNSLRRRQWQQDVQRESDAGTR